MSTDVTFSNEIDGFKEALEEKRARLEELQQKRDAHAVQTEKARQALEDLRAVLRGETPPSEEESGADSRGIDPVPVSDETGRPSRGARQEQIETICRKVGADGDVFRTADVLNVLRDVEDEVKAGLRSYTYTVMDSLEDDGVVERKGRGKWKLVD